MDSHKIWAIIGVSVAVILLGVLFYTFYSGETVAGQAAEVKSENPTGVVAGQAANTIVPSIGGVILYDRRNFTGENIMFRANVRNLSNHNRMGGGTWDNNASSLRIFGNVEVTLFEHANYSGINATTTVDIERLKSVSLGNKVSSLKIERLAGESSESCGNPGRCAYIGNMTQFYDQAVRTDGWTYGDIVQLVAYIRRFS